MKLFIFILILAIASYFYYYQGQNPLNMAGTKAPLDCIKMSDGCNTCFADNGRLFGCSKLFCEVTETPTCIKYKE